MEYDKHIKQFSRYSIHDGDHSRGNDLNDNYFSYGNSYSKKYHGYLPERKHYALFLISKIWNNRSLRVLFILVVLVVTIVVITLLIVLIPLIISLVDSLLQGGIKGIIESGTGAVDKIWNGQTK